MTVYLVEISELHVVNMEKLYFVISLFPVVCSGHLAISTTPLIGLWRRGCISFLDYLARKGIKKGKRRKEGPKIFPSPSCTLSL